MRVLIPQPLPHLGLLAEIVGREHEIVGADGTAEADLLTAIGAVDALVATAMDVSPQVIEAGRRLLVVGTPQVGYDRIAVPAATAAGVPVISCAGVSPQTVAEFTLGLMIALARRIARADRDLHVRRDWAVRRRYAEPGLELGGELHGCTVGIVGVGNIGAALAGVCRAAFDARALGFDPYVGDESMRSMGISKMTSIRELAAEADFLCLHVPLTRATRHLVDRDLLRSMKPTAFLINVARGGVVDEPALAEALSEGRLAGAALDVFEREPLTADDPLLDLEQVILTPHIAGVTVQSNDRRARSFAHRLMAVLAGERPEGIANPDVWPKYQERRRLLGLSGGGADNPEE
jgi:D-3-phosphoglycerate dehydrogenase / 2-oxoglutarate reductase